MRASVTPASRPETVNRSSTIRLRWCAWRLIAPMNSRLSSSAIRSHDSVSVDAKPITVASGPRRSWDAMATKSRNDWLAASSTALARSISRLAA